MNILRVFNKMIKGTDVTRRPETNTFYKNIKDMPAGIILYQPGLDKDTGEKLENLRDDYVCLNCQHIHERRLWSYKCEICSKMKPFPNDGVMFSCGSCGGEEELVGRIKLHDKGHTLAKL